LLLKRVGLKIEKPKNRKPVLYDIKAKLKRRQHNSEMTKYEYMASLEHARWNAERLLEGWKYGPKKDITRKLNPCLVPWEKLSMETREFDFTPINNIPLLLSGIGYEVVDIP